MLPRNSLLHLRRDGNDMSDMRWLHLFCLQLPCALPILCKAIESGSGTANSATLAN